MSKLTGRRIENTYYKLLQIDHIDGDGQGDGVVMQNGLGDPITGSINVSGSFHITGSATIRKDLRVLGNVTAQQFIATTVSSSVVYESGSSQFGNSLDDKHLYTGSLLLTGSQLTSGSATITGSLKSLGYTEITGSINTLGDSLITGSLSALGDIDLDGETNITGTLDLTTSGSWVVEGKKQLTGPIANVGDFQQFGIAKFESDRVTLNADQLITSGSSVNITANTISSRGDLDHTGEVDIDGNTIISGQTSIFGNIDHTGEHTQIGNSNQVGNSTQSGDSLLEGVQTVSGSSNISGSSYLRGTLDSDVTGDSTITGSLRVQGNTDLKGGLSQRTTGAIIHTGSVWRTGNTLHKGVLDLEGSYIGKGNWSYQGFYNLSATGSIVQVGGNYDLTGDLFVKGDTEFTGSLGVTEDITTKRSLRAAAHVQTQLISYPKTLTTDATVDPDHYSYLYGPISVAEGTTITVEQDSILTIH